MKPSSGPTLEVTLEHPCAEHRDALLDLVGMAPGEGTPRTRIAARHARGCQSCTRFLASLRGEAGVTKRLYLEWERTRARENREFADFPRWMQARLERVDGRIAARACWRAARALLIADPKYRALVVIDGPESREVTQEKAAQEFEEAIPSLRQRRLVKEIQNPVGERRVRTAQRLLVLGNDLVHQRSAIIQIALSSINWMYSDESLVSEHLQQARDVSSSTWERSEAIGNYAVWELGKGNAGNALRLNRLAILIESRKPSVLFNEVIWRTVIGDSTRAIAALRVLMGRDQTLPNALRDAVRYRENLLRAAAEQLGVPLRVAERRALDRIPWWKG